MNKELAWNKFIKTGNILYYLEYKTCNDMLCPNSGLLSEKIPQGANNEIRNKRNYT
mgnify:CR=1 FL=1